ncbi:hypothetical protein [Actinokineospora enzanensis]|uniref:hypothetical protein n=1 Tax=Actinokineospora enzanensis TaxID=155975 RepID=UPI0003822871|nr:hypothetical protein [Actinokineospora enzanensis]
MSRALATLVTAVTLTLTVITGAATTASAAPATTTTLDRTPSTRTLALARLVGLRPVLVTTIDRHGHIHLSIRFVPRTQPTAPADDEVGQLGEGDAQMAGDAVSPAYD